MTERAVRLTLKIDLSDNDVNVGLASPCQHQACGLLQGEANAVLMPLSERSPRHRVGCPTSELPKTSFGPLRTGLNGVIDALSGARHVLEMFRRTLPDSPTRTCLDRPSNRLTKSSSKQRASAPVKPGQRLAGKADRSDRMKAFPIAERRCEVYGPFTGRPWGRDEAKTSVCRTTLTQYPATSHLEETATSPNGLAG